LRVGNEGTAFLHRRSTPGGRSRVVCVSACYVDSAADEDDIIVTACSLRPAFYLWSFKTEPIYSSLRLPRPRSRDLRVFAGQPDPNDPTHLAITFISDGRPGVIDGWVLDDGAVRLEIRTAGTQPGAAPAPAPTPSRPP
jgi:hypothetical protein